MRLSFIGMSGIGKSHWSSQLVDRGFKRFCCDDMIAARLKPELTRSDGTMMSMGEWMGFPFEPQYRACEAKYLQYEHEVLEEIFVYLETDDRSSENIVVDTTGSVIYTSRQILRRLREQTTIVYLDAPLEVQERMRLAYCASPPPVIWYDKFNKLPGESNAEALARCYPELLLSRTVEYKKLAEVMLDYYTLRQPAFTVDDFLYRIDKAFVSNLRYDPESAKTGASRLSTGT